MPKRVEVVTKARPGRRRMGKPVESRIRRGFQVRLQQVAKMIQQFVPKGLIRRGECVASHGCIAATRQILVHSFGKSVVERLPLSGHRQSG
jgi:hypothetical protein